MKKKEEKKWGQALLGQVSKPNAWPNKLKG
jgi:hypothetical protein